MVNSYLASEAGCLQEVFPLMLKFKKDIKYNFILPQTSLGIFPLHVQLSPGIWVNVSPWRERQNAKERKGEVPSDNQTSKVAGTYALQCY